MTRFSGQTKLAQFQVEASLGLPYAPRMSEEGKELKILTDEVETKIRNIIIPSILQQRYDLVVEHIPSVLDDLYANIPDRKRSSYGIVHTIKVLSKYLFSKLIEMDVAAFEIASDLFATSDDFRSAGVSLGVLSFYGLLDHRRVLPLFESAANSSDWNIRELAQMFFRKLIRKYPEEMKEYLLKLVKSESPNIRRFVSETLRPVQENRWFYENPEYPLSILRNLFRESSSYPRTSVGNNLSDLSKRLPELVFDIVAELVESGDSNSYWIAYRACRNLVKKDPARVMDLLGVDDYRYKKRVYARSDYQEDQGKVDPP